MNKIFIEGVCGTGKSTITQTLAKKLPALIIPELPEFNRGLLAPFNSSENVNKNFLDYINHEAIRESIFSSSTLINSKINFIVADRSYISILALALGMRDYLEKDFISEIFIQVVNNLNNGIYHFPDKIIILQASYNNIYKRNIKKTKKLDFFWFDKKRIIPQLDFYYYLSECGLAVSVSTDEEFEKSVDNCLNECNQIQNTISGGAFLNGLYKYTEYI